MVAATVTHIYFDWSGTIARRRSKATFINPTSSLQDKKSTLYSDTIDLLKYLTGKGYVLGIISNTSKSGKDILKSMKDIGLLQYFKGSIIFANDENICKKPCKSIFEHAMKSDKVRPNNAVMVGNDYEKDIKGAKGAHMHTIFIERERPCKSVEHVHSLSQIKELL